MVTQAIPVLTSPPPKPPMKPKKRSTSPREARNVSIWRNTRSVASMLVPTGRLEADLEAAGVLGGHELLLSRPMISSERAKNTADAASTRARWCRAGLSQRR